MNTWRKVCDCSCWCGSPLMRTYLFVLVQFECTPFVSTCSWEFMYVQGSKYVYLYLLFVLLPLELLEEEVCNGIGPVLSRCLNYRSFLG